MSEPIPHLSFAYAGASRSRWRAHPKGVNLLRRYPQIGQNEVADLITIVQGMRASEIALMMADEDLGPRLEAFCNEHRPWLGNPVGSYAVIAILMIGVALLTWIAGAV